MLATPEPTAGATSVLLPHSSSAWQVVLGFDFGRIRTGVAVGDAVTRSARPLCVLTHSPYWEAIAALITTWHPDGLVVGVPRHADDTANPMTHAALRFSRQLQGRLHLPVATIDERLSSWEAQQRQFNTVTHRRKKQAQCLDAQAAAVILESWFNQPRSLA